MNPNPRSLTSFLIVPSAISLSLLDACCARCRVRKYPFFAALTNRPAALSPHERDGRRHERMHEYERQEEWSRAEADDARECEQVARDNQFGPGQSLTA